MPKIISLTSLGDTLYVLYDSGFIFASSGEKSWYRVTLPRPYQLEEAAALAPVPESGPDSWKEFRRKMRANVPANGYYWCPVCNKSIFRYDSAALKSCWKVGHFVGQETGK